MFSHGKNRVPITHSYRPVKSKSSHHDLPEPIEISTEETTYRCFREVVEGDPAPGNTMETFGFRPPHTNFYVQRANLGRDTRVLEFKDRVDNAKPKLTPDVTLSPVRLVVGFLNSLEGGRIVQGVTDDGFIKGTVDTFYKNVNLDTLNYHLRSSVSPGIPKELCTAKYVQVVDEKGCPLKDTSVLEIFVSRQRYPENLYRMRGVAYIRKDSGNSEMEKDTVDMWIDFAKETYLLRIRRKLGEIEALMEEILK